MSYLAGEEMPTDFHKDLVVLVRSLVPRYNDFSTRQVLELIHLETEASSEPLAESLALRAGRRTHRLTAFTDDPAGCGRRNLDVCLQFDLLLP